ncbi:hypothetical protein F511_18087 [Dorcoceras hygrometricum]|uniref:Uncharacterized protein n=1 Tax=Dorcoceras hygrometricum TaxID=472368 RepID=A0A2Z7ADU6_9LAMI|nr:hypothetical protein F511_18087 [Dorcoceras hygrometricum]
MRIRFSDSDVPIRAPNKKKENEDGVSSAARHCREITVCEGCSFDMVTSEKFDLMVAISVGLKSGSIPAMTAGSEGISIAGGPEVLSETRIGKEHIVVVPGGHERIGSKQDYQDGGDDHHEENQGCDTQMDQEGETTEIEDWVDKDEGIERYENRNNTEKETNTNAKAIVVRSGPEQPAQHTFTYTGHGIFAPIQCWGSGSAPPIAVVTPIRSTTRSKTPSSGCTRSPDEISTNGFSTSSWPETNFPAKTAAAASAGEEKRREGRLGTCVTLNGSGIQLAVGPQPLWLRNHNSGPAQRIMIREINWATHFLPTIDPADKGKGLLEVISRPNTVEEHCQLVFNSAWEVVSNTMADLYEWIHFRTALAEMVDHLKKSGDAKKGEGGQSGNRPGEGSGRQGEGPSSTRGKGPSPSYRRCEDSSRFKSKWF